MKKEAYLKLTEETRKEFVSLFTAKAMQDFIKITKEQADADSGTFKVVISSDDEDRQGESVNQDGLDFKNYMENPVVLWGHDYYSPPIGVCTRIYREGMRPIAAGGLTNALIIGAGDATGGARGANDGENEFPAVVVGSGGEVADRRTSSLDLVVEVVDRRGVGDLIGWPLRSCRHLPW